MAATEGCYTLPGHLELKIPIRVEVASGQTIRENWIIGLDSTGKAIAAVGSDEVMLGMSDTYEGQYQYDGGEMMHVRAGTFEDLKLAFSQVNVGKVCYAADNETVTMTAGSKKKYGVIVGKPEDNSPTTHSRVYVNPLMFL